MTTTTHFLLLLQAALLGIAAGLLISIYLDGGGDGGLTVRKFAPTDGPLVPALIGPDDHTRYN